MMVSLPCAETRNVIKMGPSFISIGNNWGTTFYQKVIYIPRMTTRRVREKQIGKIV